MKRLGTRAEVMHGTAKMTKGGLTKDKLRFVKGRIVGIKQSNRMMNRQLNPLAQKGLLVTKGSGVFGVRNQKSKKNNNNKRKKSKKSFSFLNLFN
jgi:hypothetical protein